MAGPALPPFVSCDPSGLYAQGGFPGLADERDRVMRSGRGAEAVCALFPPFGYARPPRPGAVAGNPDFRAELAAMQAHANTHRPRGAAAGLYRVADAVLRDNVIYVRGVSSPEPSESGLNWASDADGPRVLYETYRPQDRATVTLATPAELAAPMRAVEGPCLFFSSSGSFNYGHWLVDDLPRLAAFRALRRRHPAGTITILVTAHQALIDDVRLRSINLVLTGERDFRVEFLRQDEVVRVPALYFASPVTVHPALKSPQALGALARLLRRRTAYLRLKLTWEGAVAALRARSAPRLRRRLFVDRGPFRSRPLANGEAVFAALARFGFERVDADGLTFARQVATFADAAIVVGNTGAAMTNTLFCRPGTPVVHLGPEGWVETFFWDLATVMGHRYHALYGPPRDASTPYVGPFTIDPERLSRMVGRLL